MVQFLHAIADELCGRSVDYPSLFALKGSGGSGGASSNSDLNPVVSACKDVLSSCVAGSLSGEQVSVTPFPVRNVLQACITSAINAAYRVSGQANEVIAATGVDPAGVAAFQSVLESRRVALQAANVARVAALSKQSLQDFDWSVRVRERISVLASARCSSTRMCPLLAGCSQQ